METINIEKDSQIVLDTQAKEIKININNCRVVISDISKANKVINVNGGYLDYCLIKKKCDCKNKIIVNKGEVNLRVIDLVNDYCNDEYLIDLNKVDSSLDFSITSIAKGDSKKHYLIKSNNNVANTNVKIDCFGISEDKSEIKYDVTSFIKNGAKKAIVNQNSKILLFDKESKGINNPILEIEENDVKANHGSSIGMIDEETLFYLTSRGIKEQDARNLVSLGKINYLIETIKEERIKNDLLNEILERV